MAHIKQYCLFLLFILFNILHTYAQNISEFAAQFESIGFVNDFANMLKPSEKQRIEDIIIAINDSSSIQFGVCLLDSLAGFPADKLAMEIGNLWGVGQKETNNGTTILVSKKERAIHIATGLGTEKYVNDEKVKAIIEGTLKPAFRYGDFELGLTEAIIKLYQPQIGTDLDSRTKPKFNWLRLALLLGFIILVILLWLLFKNKNRKKDKLDNGNDELFGGGKFREGSGAEGAW